MKLASPGPNYSQPDETKLRFALQAADQENQKKGRDLVLARGENIILASRTGLVAHAGGGQASALQLVALVNEVDTVATAGDSVKLPLSAAGMSLVTIINRGANACQVFGAGTDTVNGVATATGVSQAAGVAATYFAPAAGTWFSLPSGTPIVGGIPTGTMAQFDTACTNGDFVYQNQTATLTGLTMDGAVTMHSVRDIKAGDAIGSVNISGGTTGATDGAYIVLRGASQSFQPGSLEFYCGNVQRQRFLTGGQVMFNTNALSNGALGSQSLQCAGELFSIGATAGVFWEDRSGSIAANTNWGGWYTISAGPINLYWNGANRSQINQSTGAFSAVSDDRRKTGVAQTRHGLDAVLKLRPVDYEMTEGDAGPQTGFLAQDVRAAIPAAVTEGPAGLDTDATVLMLNTTPIVAALVAAVQQLTARVAALEA